MVLDLVLVPFFGFGQRQFTTWIFACSTVVFTNHPLYLAHTNSMAFARSIWIANASCIAKSFNPRPRRFEAGRPVPYQILASDDEKVLGHLKRLLVCKNH